MAKDRKKIVKGEEEGGGLIKGLVGIALDPMQIPVVVTTTAKAYQLLVSWMAKTWSVTLFGALLALLGVEAFQGAIPLSGVGEALAGGVEEAAYAVAWVIGLELVRRAAGHKVNGFQWALENVMPRIPVQIVVASGIVLTAISRGVDLSSIIPGLEVLDVLHTFFLVGPLLLLGTLDLHRRHEKAKEVAEREATKVIVPENYGKRCKSPAETPPATQNPIDSRQTAEE